jgi:hypothetical protein
VSESVQYFRVAEGEPLPDISAYRPFKAVVVIEATYTPGWQEMVSKWLVENGCLYMMAWGEGCSSWDDSVDWANLEEFDYGEIPDDRFVMTTWHERETLKEVFWYAHFCASHADVDVHQSLIIHIATCEAHSALLELFAAARQPGYLPD